MRVAYPESKRLFLSFTPEEAAYLGDTVGYRLVDGVLSVYRDSRGLRIIKEDRVVQGHSYRVQFSDAATKSLDLEMFGLTTIYDENAIDVVPPAGYAFAVPPDRAKPAAKMRSYHTRDGSLPKGDSPVQREAATKLVWDQATRNPDDGFCDWKDGWSSERVSRESGLALRKVRRIVRRDRGEERPPVVSKRRVEPPQRRETPAASESVDLCRLEAKMDRLLHWMEWLANRRSDEPSLLP